LNLKDYHNIYLIGIGGIGMSAIARWFKANGHFVAGYDRTETVLTKNLQSEGIDVYFDDDETLLPEDVIEGIDKTLVIYTPAIPDSHTQYNYIKGAGYKLLKRSEVLGEITKTQFTIAVAGTHGKTTTSSMIAHILNVSGKNCTAFVGGIMTNYDSNILIGKNPEESIIVVEADEFDRSFLTIHPDIAVVTSVDADHMDVYGTKKALKKTFREFIGNFKH
jgi:UDP-N-acetylmuramate--alanine ligase